MGLPLVIHEVNTMVSAPRLTISAALVTAFLPGQPPQVTMPIISISSSTPAKAPFLSRIILKSVVPGHMSSVCRHLIKPTFTTTQPFLFSLGNSTFLVHFLHMKIIITIVG